MSNKQKILYVITKSFWGGAQKYVADLATSLPRDQFDVEVATGGDGPLVAHLRQHNIPVHILKYAQRDIGIRQELLLTHELFKLYKKVQPTIVHLNSSKIGGTGSLVARLSGIKNIIFTAHGWAFNEKRNFFSQKIIQLLSWVTILLCHSVIVLSQKEKNQVMHWPWIHESKIHIIPNGISAIHILPREEARLALLPEYPHAQNMTWIGTIGELHKNKGYQYAINAFAKVDRENVLYIIIGDGEERSSVEQSIKNYRLQDRVFLCSSIQHAARYISAFDIFLLPSVKEGLPYTLLEAGIAARPVVATSVGGIPEIIINEETGLLIEPSNPKEITDALVRYIDNSDLQNTHRHALQKHVESNFGHSTMMTKVVGLYTQKSL